MIRTLTNQIFMYTHAHEQNRRYKQTGALQNISLRTDSVNSTSECDEQKEK